MCHSCNKIWKNRFNWWGLHFQWKVRSFDCWFISMYKFNNLTSSIQILISIAHALHKKYPMWFPSCFYFKYEKLCRERRLCVCAYGCTRFLTWTEQLSSVLVAVHFYVFLIRHTYTLFYLISLIVLMQQSHFLSLFLFLIKMKDSYIYVPSFKIWILWRRRL